MRTLLFINRPNDDFNRGTGISATFFWLKKKLNDSGDFKVIECKKLLGTKPFGSMRSILVYDYLNPIIIAIKKRNSKIDFLVFSDPAQSFFMYLLKRILNKPKTVVIIQDLLFLNKTLYSKYAKIINEIAIKNADYIITTTEENERLLKAEYTKLPPISILPLGLTIFDGENNTKKIDIAAKDNAVIIGYLGSSQPRKRLYKITEFVHHSINNDKNVFLLLAGPIGNDFFNKLDEIKDDRFQYQYLGLISEKEKTAFFNTIDIFIFPTELEGFGLPILESFYYRKPCVIYKDAEIPSIFKKYCWQMDDSFISVQEVFEKQLRIVSADPYLLKEIENNYNYALGFNWSNFISFFRDN